MKRQPTCGEPGGHQRLLIFRKVISSPLISLYMASYLFSYSRVVCSKDSGLIVCGDE